MLPLTSRTYSYIRLPIYQCRPGLVTTEFDPVDRVTLYGRLNTNKIYAENVRVKIKGSMILTFLKFFFYGLRSTYVYWNTLEHFSDCSFIKKNDYKPKSEKKSYTFNCVCVRIFNNCTIRLIYNDICWHLPP